MIFTIIIFSQLSVYDWILLPNIWSSLFLKNTRKNNVKNSLYGFYQIAILYTAKAVLLFNSKIEHIMLFLAAHAEFSLTFLMGGIWNKS